MPNIGTRFQPGTGQDIPGKGSANGSGPTGPQGPVKLMNFRVPKSPLGQSAIAPRSLLESPGSGGAGLNGLIQQLMRGIAPQASTPGVVAPPQAPVSSAPSPVSQAPPIFTVPPRTPGVPGPILQPMPGPPPLADAPGREEIDEPPPLFEIPRVPQRPEPAPQPQREVPQESAPPSPPRVIPGDQGPQPPVDAPSAPPSPPIEVPPQPDAPPIDLAPLPVGNDTQSLFDEPMDWFDLKRRMAQGGYDF